MTQERPVRHPIKLRSLADLPALVDATVGMSARVQSWTPENVIAFDGVFGGIRSLLAVTIARHAPNVLVLVPQAVDADIVSGDCIALGASESVALPLSATDGTVTSMLLISARSSPPSVHACR